MYYIQQKDEPWGGEWLLRTPSNTPLTSYKSISTMAYFKLFHFFSDFMTTETIMGCEKYMQCRITH
jgi:hypothetical protein